jgi:hypothetical protein
MDRPRACFTGHFFAIFASLCSKVLVFVEGRCEAQAIVEEDRPRKERKDTETERRQAPTRLDEPIQPRITPIPRIRKYRPNTEDRPDVPAHSRCSNLEIPFYDVCPMIGQLTGAASGAGWIAWRSAGPARYGSATAKFRNDDRARGKVQR